MKKFLKSLAAILMSAAIAVSMAAPAYADYWDDSAFFVDVIIDPKGKETNSSGSDESYADIFTIMVKDDSSDGKYHLYGAFNMEEEIGDATPYPPEWWSDDFHNIFDAIYYNGQPFSDILDIDETTRGEEIDRKLEDAIYENCQNPGFMNACAKLFEKMVAYNTIEADQCVSTAFDGNGNEVTDGRWKFCNVEVNYYYLALLDSRDREDPFTTTPSSTFAPMLFCLTEEDAGKTIEMDAKTQTPFVTKTVKALYGGDGEEKKEIVAGPGDILKFTVRAKAPDNIESFYSTDMTNLSPFTWSFNDVMTNGLKAEEGSAELQVTNVKQNLGASFSGTGVMVPESGFTRTETTAMKSINGNSYEETTYRYELRNIWDTLLRYSGAAPTKDSEFILTYWAQIPEDGNFNGTMDVVNDAYAEYTLTPDSLPGTSSSALGTTPVSEVRIYDFDVRIEADAFKGDSTALHGGEYVLYKNVDGDWDKEHPIPATETEDGVFTAYGIGTGEFLLHEVKTPKGCSPLKDIEINIKSASVLDGILTGFDCEVDGTSYLSAEEIKNFTIPIKVEHSAAPILPNTGSVGAGAVLCVSGCMAILGIAMVLLSRKKADHN